MTVTPIELETVWAVIGKIGVAVASIVALIKGVQFLFSLSPTSRLEVRVARCEANLEKDFKRLERHDDEISELKKTQQNYHDEMHRAVKGIGKIGTAQISLLRHMIDGNGVEEMKIEADDLTKFFIEQ